VYLNHGSSHCTGILISPRLILTVRHLFSATEPPIGTDVSIRLYPYNGLRTAKLIILPLKFIDLAVL
jgi:V8-like Glu-specific endopeptidase